ncbi:MAG: hypothetical protein NTW16_04165 [Bacteroidetes bacterium]|nr:hypothetical protein [Bacteroidota bacterium]
MMDAKVAKPFEIFRSLTAIVNYWSTDSMGRWRVLVISWMKQSSTQFWPVGQTFSTSNNQAYMSWITPAPEMLDFQKRIHAKTAHEADLNFPSWVSQKHRSWFLNEITNKYDTSSVVAVTRILSSWQYYQLSLTRK